VVEQSKRANVGHIGSSLSIVDILVALYADVLEHGDSNERDRFLLSKGHAALALYCTLYATGRLSQDALETFGQDGTLLGVHPDHGLTGIDFSSGSLGQGLAVATGAAVAARLQRSPRRVFVLLSDAECNEGAVWESVMFGAHHALSNLVAIIDLNGQQAFGHTKEVLSLEPLADRWRAFGWDVHEVDGHDVGALSGSMRSLDYRAGPPHVIVAQTTFGRGVSYMEGSIDWHYRPMSDEQFAQAKQELEA
jgi:transketolase